MSAGMRLFLLLAISALVLVTAIAAATAIGEYNIPVRTVFLTVTNEFGRTNADVPKIEASVVWNLRLSRSRGSALC
ncbi:MAG: iron ABC transporter permease, partial [Martelella sp.]